MSRKERYPELDETKGGKPRLWVKSREIVKGMAAWFEDINTKHLRPSRDGRTREEQLFDSGVFAASEVVRRLTCDDELSLAVHEACIWRQREHADNDAKSLPPPAATEDE